MLHQLRAASCIRCERRTIAKGGAGDNLFKDVACGESDGIEICPISHKKAHEIDDPYKVCRDKTIYDPVELFRWVCEMNNNTYPHSMELLSEKDYKYLIGKVKNIDPSKMNSITNEKCRLDIQSPFPPDLPENSILRALDSFKDGGNNQSPLLISSLVLDRWLDHLANFTFPMGEDDNFDMKRVIRFALAIVYESLRENDRSFINMIKGNASDDIFFQRTGQRINSLRKLTFASSRLKTFEVFITRNDAYEHELLIRIYADFLITCRNQEQRQYPCHMLLHVLPDVIGVIEFDILNEALEYPWPEEPGFILLRANITQGEGWQIPNV